MDIGRTVKPVSAAQASYARPAVATELDPSRSVTVAADGAAVADHDPTRMPPSPQQTARDVLIDPQAREVIFRAMSANARKMAGEEPEEAMRQLAAYGRAERKKRRPDGEVVEITA